MAKRKTIAPRESRVRRQPDVSFTALNGLAKFLRLRGNTLLIKGYAGAGKTTLALQLLRGLSKGQGKGVYISSRVSEEKVHNELPWLREEEEGRNGDSEFLDVRLSSANSFLEEILLAIKPKGRKANPPVVVLDTWDGIAKEMSTQERLKAEKTLIALADSSKTRMVFVSEEPERTTMDYLVDGMIELTRGEEFGRVFREVEIQKLRGTSIDQHRYLYTLDGGFFRQIHPYGPPDLSRASKPEVIQDTGDRFSFGSPQLDQLFGGLVKGGSFAFVYDEKVPYNALRLVELSAVVNALNLGRGVFILPLPGASNEEISGFIRPFVSPQAYRECFAIGSFGGSGAEVEPPFHHLSDANIKDASNSVSGMIKHLREKSALKSVLAMESVGSAEGAYASRLETVLEATMNRVASVRESQADSLVLFVQNDSVIRSQILSMCGRYARMFMKDRSVVLMGEKPASPGYVLDHLPENPLLARLTLVV
jgi:KaiC/GvpD/RAD55 family RecA-like ATPase